MKFIKKLSLILAGVLTGALAFVAIGSGAVSAEAPSNLQWVDTDGGTPTVSSNQGNFVHSLPSHTYMQEQANPSDGCRNRLQNFSNDFTEAQFVNRQSSGTRGGCQVEETVEVRISNTGALTDSQKAHLNSARTTPDEDIETPDPTDPNAPRDFRWTNSRVIESSAGRFLRRDANPYFETDSGCQPSRLSNFNQEFTQATLVWYMTGAQGSCIERTPRRVTIERADWLSDADRESLRLALTSGTAENEGECRAEGPFGWMVCGLMSMAGSGMDWIKDHVIDPFLVVSPLTTHDEVGDETEAFAAWQAMRTLANVLLVPVFLAIIFAQALSLNIDAYTIKKMLPRLIAAALLIQLSYYIAAIMVDVTNILGLGLGELVTRTVIGEDYAPGELGSAFLTVGLGVGGFVGITTLIAGTSAGLAGLLLLVLPALIALIGVFFTLVFRQLLIIFLAILAPIAFLAWVLPNTEKTFKMWWSFFIKALMMFPLITLLFAAGIILSRVALGMAPSGPGGDTIGTILGFGALIAPLFLIPFTFKMAGPALGAFSDGLNKLTSRVGYGKDGRGGVAGSLQPRVDERKKAIGAGLTPTDTRLGSAIMKTPGLRRAATAGARPGMGIGNRSAALAAADFNEERNMAEKYYNDHGMMDGRIHAHFADVGNSKRAFNQRVEALLNSDSQTDRDMGRQLQSMEHLVGKPQYQAASLKVAASQGQSIGERYVDETLYEDGNQQMFQSAADAMGGNEAIRSMVVGGAAFEARERNPLLLGLSTNHEGRVSYNRNRAIDSLRNLPVDKLAALPPPTFEVLAGMRSDPGGQRVNYFEQMLYHQVPDPNQPDRTITTVDTNAMETLRQLAGLTPPLRPKPKTPNSPDQAPGSTQPGSVMPGMGATMPTGLSAEARGLIRDAIGRAEGKQSERIPHPNQRPEDPSEPDDNPPPPTNWAQS